METNIKRKPLRSRISIRTRLFGGFVLFVGIIMLVLFLSQVVFFEEIYKLTKIAEIKSAAHELTAKINDPELETIAEEIGQRKNVCISVLLVQDDKSIRTAVSADCIERCLIHNPHITESSFYELYEFIQEMGGERLQHYRYDFEKEVYYATEGTLFDRSSDEASIVYTILLKDDYGNNLMVMLNSVITPVNATVRTLQIQLILISVFLILISTLLALFLSIRIAKPLRILNGKAKLLGQSDYSVDFSTNGYREITELGETLNHAKDELSKVDRLKSELIANISHDLRTPLTMITGYAEVMRDIPGESTPENFEIIIDEARRLNSLVNELLDHSKLQSGAITLNPTKFSITQCLIDSLDRYNKMLGSQNYRLLLHADTNVLVCTDRIRFEQALQNLLSNAITHTGEDQTVTVTQNTLTNNEGRPIAVRISVIDSGEGIEASELPYIWDRYYKVDKIHKRAPMGSGLGLSIVKTIMDRLGGTYGVQSTPGIGSCFWLQLPLSEGNPLLPPEQK